METSNDVIQYEYDFDFQWIPPHSSGAFEACQWICRLWFTMQRHVQQSIPPLYFLFEGNLSQAITCLSSLKAYINKLELFLVPTTIMSRILKETSVNIFDYEVILQDLKAKLAKHSKRKAVKPKWSYKLHQQVYFMIYGGLRSWLLYVIPEHKTRKEPPFTFQIPVDSSNPSTCPIALYEILSSYYGRTFMEKFQP
jgi:hypothetical protein